MEKEIEKLAEEYALKNAIGVIDGLGLNEAFIAGFKAGLTRNEAITSELRKENEELKKKLNEK